MRRRERFNHRIMGADGVVSLLKSFFRERVGGEGEEGTRKYFATWSPYRMRKVHVELIGKKEIIDRTRSWRGQMVCGRCTTSREPTLLSTASNHDEGARRHRAGAGKEGGGHLAEEEESRLVGLGEVKVTHTERWTGDEAGEPLSGENMVNVRKVKRTYRIKTRLASCFARRASVLNTGIATSAERTRVSFPH